MSQEPFDARRTWLSETGQAPHSEWRTVSLVTALKALVEDGDDSAERLLTRAVMSELGSRGIDPDALLRYGLMAELLSPLVMWLLLDDGPDAQLTRQFGLDVEAWSHALESPTPAFTVVTKVPDAPLARVLARLGPAAVWFMNAPTDALLDRRAPTATDLAESVHSGVPDTGVLSEYRWIVERFSTTRLAEWSTSSLHLELLWLRGGRASACRSELMADREVDPLELSVEIAKRAVAPDETPTFVPVHSLAVQMQAKARALLGDGQRTAAAALFEFAVSQAPSDPQAHNNLGFCLLPDEPQKALGHLRQAAELGYQPLAVNVHNQVTCLLTLGQPHEALTVAEGLWPLLGGEADFGGVLWAQTDSGAHQLAEFDSARGALAELCHSVAGRVGGEDLRAAWQERRPARGPGPH